ncbi:MAG: F0F1 ATP synthase subunit delta [Actinomycetes bacterium]|jgi:F-type H+-transporting ATPase subunit delta|nr:F0F1 ATP synthase subunit delta [Actinomycetes bacterium]
MLTNTVESRAVVAEVVTAYPLSDKTRDHLVEKLSSALRRPVELDEHLDPQVIGGIRINVLGRLFDSTVATQLHELQLNLASTISGGGAHGRSD